MAGCLSITLSNELPARAGVCVPKPRDCYTDTASVFVVWPAESFAWRLRSTGATLVDSLARLFKNGSKDVAMLGNGEPAPLGSELSDSFVK